MNTRLPNPRRVKIHRSYSVEDAARTLGKHKNTIRAWIREGLPTCDGKRPTLILGHALRTFLEAKRRKNKRPLRPGEIYCVRCRTPQRPAGQMAECQPTSASLGHLIGICPDCDGFMYRRVSLGKVRQIAGDLDITFPTPGRHISA